MGATGKKMRKLVLTGVNYRIDCRRTINFSTMTASTNATAYATCFRLCRSARHHGNLHSACRAVERLGNRTVQSDRTSDLGYALVRCSNRLYRLA